MEGIIRVEGRGTVRRRPDIIRLDFTLRFEDPKYEEALRRYESGYRRLSEAAVSAGVGSEEVLTDQLQIGTHYEQEHDGRNYRNVFKGYMMTSHLYLELPMDLDLLSSLISRISEQGETPEFTVTFGVKSEEEAQHDALKEAAADARKKAEVLAESLALSLGHVKNVTALGDVPALYGSRIEMPREMKAMDIQMNPKDVEIERVVEVTYQIL